MIDNDDKNHAARGLALDRHAVGSRTYQRPPPLRQRTQTSSTIAGGDNSQNTDGELLPDVFSIRSRTASPQKQRTQASLALPQGASDETILDRSYALPVLAKSNPRHRRPQEKRKFPGSKVDSKAPSYEHLREGEIRLLRLSPSKGHETPIEGLLGSFTLEMAPGYTAISYAWGNRKRGKTMRLGGRFIRITASLKHALVNGLATRRSSSVHLGRCVINQSGRCG